MGEALPVMGLMGMAVNQGRQAEKKQKEAMKAQEQAQKTAEANAVRQERISGMEKMRANQKRPDMMSLLTAAKRPSTQGAASTMLTQPYGSNSTLG